MATGDAASFDHETASENLACNPNPESSVRKMSFNIPVNDDGDFAVKKEVPVPLSVKNARVLHSQVKKIREEDERLGEDLNQKIAFLPIASQMQDVLFSFSRRTFPSRLGMKAGFR